eukprot:CAMPEP_0197286098 /NCGR_PEP_ID=MMETSP0890-20130614/1546_1 /TAXON_ID=44058 ORGANISM="Aureoumbra lagunensis, Strain CCMP1510" /NCGR_SAMPLE_ID=MMETSP0890 /ASSEMBLY_ACC=CAM_ASM_000533 /LENGTH=907 /DNA_ID=CAMNT_0042754213 /DNA_START=87 /DNA_END=2811 /DNA_ORIENTATION=+
MSVCESTISASSNPLYDEHMLIEVEIDNWRGIIDDVQTTVNEEAYYVCSLQLVDAKTGSTLEHEVKWYRFPGDTRQRSFLSRRYSRDRFAFPVLVHANEIPNVRFEMFRKSSKRSNSLSLSLNTQYQTSKLIGVAEITPLTAEQDEYQYFRWIRLAADAHCLPGRTKLNQEQRHQQTMLGWRKNRQNIAPAQTKHSASVKGIRMRKEVHVLATARQATGEKKIDLIQAADSKKHWFVGLPVPVNIANVVRIACIRTDDIFLSQQAIIAARVKSSVEDIENDDVSVFFQATNKFTTSNNVAFTQRSTCGVWMQVLSVPIPPNIDKSSLVLDLAILHAANTDSKRDVEPVLGGRVCYPLDEVLHDESVWLRIPPSASLKLAARLDYDEFRDFCESRAFFDSELEIGGRDPDVTKKDYAQPTTVIPRQCNIVRIALARARKIRPAQLSSKVTNVGARIEIKGKNPHSRASQLASVQPLLNSSGAIVWNECFEFPLMNEDGPLECFVTIFGDDPARQYSSISLQLPNDGTVSRNWLSLGDSSFAGELLIVASCDDDPSIRQNDAHWAITEALSYAFPDASIQTIERVFAATNSVEDACVALSTTMNDREKAPASDIDRELFASANATNLSWMVSPILEERTTEFAALVDGDDMKMDEDEATARKKLELKKNKLSHLTRSSSVIPLTRMETIDLIKNQDANTMAFSLSILSKPDPSFSSQQQVTETEVDYENEEEHQTIILIASGKRRPRQVPHRRPRMSVTVKTTFDVVQDSSGRLARKVEMKVQRVPLDFAALRRGVVDRLRSDKDLPPLPHWVVSSLRLDTNAYKMSLAAGATTAGITAAVALATAPVALPLLVTAGAAVSILGSLGTFNSATYISLNKIQNEIDNDTFLTDLVQSVKHTQKIQAMKSR